MIKINTKHSNTLQALFETPIRSDIKVRDVYALLMALGFNERKGKGSHLVFSHPKFQAIFVISVHNKHQTLKTYTILTLRKVLLDILGKDI